MKEYDFFVKKTLIKNIVTNIWGHFIFKEKYNIFSGKCTDVEEFIYYLKVAKHFLTKIQIFNKHFKTIHNLCRFIQEQTSMKQKCRFFVYVVRS